MLKSLHVSLIIITHSIIKAMLDKFALKFNKCALNVEIDMKIRKNNQRIKNDANVQLVSEISYFFCTSPTFRL